MTENFAHYSANQPHDAPAVDAIVGWLQRRRTEHVPQLPSGELQLAALRERGQSLLALEEATDTFLVECGGPGPVPGAVGRLGGTLLVEYFRWGQGFDDVQVEPYLQYFHDELAGTAHHRQSLLRAALQLSFSNDPHQRSDAGRASLHGLGDAHRRLVDLLRHLAEVQN